jgi:hypothetical protein
MDAMLSPAFQSLKTKGAKDAISATPILLNDIKVYNIYDGIYVEIFWYTLH